MRYIGQAIIVLPIFIFVLLIVCFNRHDLMGYLMAYLFLAPFIFAILNEFVDEKE